MTAFDMALKINRLAVLLDDDNFQAIKSTLTEIEYEFTRLYQIRDKAMAHKNMLEAVMIKDDEDIKIKANLRDFRMGAIEKLQWVVDEFDGKNEGEE